ncbi:MAG: type IV pilus assembly protein PilB [Gammaproteobacteria bacterium]|jgi:type IV pilus assembly protein PilB
MTAEEKILATVPSSKSVIDLPPSPFCIEGEKGNLFNAAIELHYMKGVIEYGALRSIDDASEQICFVSSQSHEELEIKYSDVRFVIFPNELRYQLKDHPLQNQSAVVVKPELPQSFNIKFNDGTSLSGDSAISVDKLTGLHLFKVKQGNIATRMFVPKSTITMYSIGKQIGTVLKAQKVVTEEGLAQGLQTQETVRKRPIGEYLKDQGVVTDAELKKTLRQQNNFPKVRLGELLIAEGLISQAHLDEALLMQKGDRGRRLGDILIDIGATTEDAVHSALAQKLGVPFVKLREFEIDPAVLELVPVDIARKHSVMPLMTFDKYLVVAVPEPSMGEVTNILAFVSNRRIELAVATPGEITWAIDHYYGDIIEDDEGILAAQIVPSKDDQDEEMEKLANERPIVRLVQNLLAESIERNASDIHIRPLSKSVQVLFRIHGKLTHIRNFGKSLLAPIVSRIKVVAHMDVAQRRIPQDGRVQVTMNGQIKDMRVSSIPTVEGESVVIRILASATSLKPLDELGFSEGDTEILAQLLQRGSGMILVTGPTGSGKSTTLYSALNVLREMNVNIITVEDPVEIRLDGLEQVQVHHEYGMGFERVLRNVLRHDPDVIMIGEIRDEETAKIAVKAAQTGHLVLSTLHTNSAADTIFRLREMNVEPYMIASALRGIVAQRLIKKNCDHCRVEEEVSATTRQLLGVGENDKFYVGEGCDNCDNTGISGRVPAYEFLNVTPSIQQGILGNISSLELNDLAHSWGMKPLSECAMKYARSGETAIAEVHRIYTT